MPYKDPEKRKEWKRLNAAKRRDHYLLNREKVLKQSRKYYEENREKCLEADKTRYWANRDEIRAKQRQYYHKNSTAIANTDKIYRSTRVAPLADEVVENFSILPRSLRREYAQDLLGGFGGVPSRVLIEYRVDELLAHYSGI